KRLMSVFHYALKQHGYLMLGAAETVGTSSDLFAIADKKHRIYTKRNGAVVTVPANDYFLAPDYIPHVGEQRPPYENPRSTQGVQHEADRIIFSRFAPPAVIVDSEMKIVQFRGKTGHYLEPAPGEASLNLLKMAREGLLYGLRTA